MVRHAVLDDEQEASEDVFLWLRRVVEVHIPQLDILLEVAQCPPLLLYTSISGFISIVSRILKPATLPVMNKLIHGDASSSEVHFRLMTRENWGVWVGGMKEGSKPGDGSRSKGSQGGIQDGDDDVMQDIMR